MTQEQVVNWILEQIKKNPNLAKEYKELKISRLIAELKDNKSAFNRKGYMSYKNPVFAKGIAKSQDEIQKIERKTDEELLVEDFVMWYGDTKSTEDLIDYIKNLTDEDQYIAGVFQGTKYKYIIRCQEDLNNKLSRQNKEVDKITKIYKKGLSKRDEYIKKGEKIHQEVLADEQEYLKQHENIDEKGPEIIQKLIDQETKEKKFYCRSLAQMSVVDAFDAMGAHPAPKQTEQIDKIIEMHDPKVVESAMQKMLDNPTRNMLALAQNISETPAQDRKTLKLMKALDYVQIAVGSALSTLGIASVIAGDPSWFSMALGAFNLGLGFPGIARHSRKTNHFDEKERLMSGCIQDLLNEVESQELQKIFDEGMER